MSNKDILLELERENQKKFPVLREILGGICYLAAVVAVSLLVVIYVVQRTEVIGPSMNDTLADGESLLINKLSYRFHDPERFDVIVFDYEFRADTHYIKRIIGLPGEVVQIKEGIVYINGEKLDDPYGKEVIINPKRASEPITLGEDEYFVLGDNRNNSSDSRDLDVGNVKKDQIIGKILIRIWPLNRFGGIE